MKTTRIDFNKADWQAPVKGARFKVAARAGRQMRIVEFTSEFVEPNWCLRGHIGMVLEGEMDLEFAGGVVEFRAGDGIFILPGEAEKHRHARGASRLLVVEDVPA